MTPAGSGRQLVVFRLHGELYGLPLGAVREIIRYTAPSATAAATGLIQGMINLRGQVLAVADLSGRLGRPPVEITRTTRILVLELAGGSLGLIVDNVEGVRDVPAEQVGPLPVAGGEDSVGEEIAAVDDRLILLLDPERALAGVLGRPAPRRRTTRRAPAKRTGGT